MMTHLIIAFAWASVPATPTFARVPASDKILRAIIGPLRTETTGDKIY